MFDLDRAIWQWRQQMAAGGVTSSKVLDELESHLRDDIASLVSGGIPEAQAFGLAASRLGGAGVLSAEFKKLRKLLSVPLKIAALLWTGLAAALVAVLLTGVVPARQSLLLAAHIFCLTAGYAATFLTGGFGIYCVCRRRQEALSVTAEEALSRAVLSFSRLSAGLVLAGLLLGMLWSRQNLGSYFAGGVSEPGTSCASGWLVAFWLLQSFGRVSNRVTMLLCILGNMIVSLAWFGTGIVAHGNGLGSSWLLDAWLGAHLAFLAMGVMPGFETAEA